MIFYRIAGQSDRVRMSLERAMAKRNLWKYIYRGQNSCYIYTYIDFRPLSYLWFGIKQCHHLSHRERVDVEINDVCKYAFRLQFNLVEKRFSRS